MKKYLTIILIFISFLIILSILLYQTFKKPATELAEPTLREPMPPTETESDTTPKIETVDTAEIVTTETPSPPPDKPIVPLETESESIPGDDTLALLDLDLIPLPQPPVKPTEEKPVTVLKHYDKTPESKKDIDEFLFRSQPVLLSDEDVKHNIKEHSFFDAARNSKNNGFANQFELQIIEDNRVVIDHAAGLMWQKGGSLNTMIYEDATKWIQKLNQEKFAGFTDWRLPTLEEAMSLTEREKKKADELYLYINPIFNGKQRWIWTSDRLEDESRAWVVSYKDGTCYHDTIKFINYVRAVRSIKPSGE